MLSCSYKTKNVQIALLVATRTAGACLPSGVHCNCEWDSSRTPGVFLYEAFARHLEVVEGIPLETRDINP